MEKELATSINRWLSRLGSGAGKSYLSVFNRFLRWLKENGGEFADMNPDDLVNYMDNASRKKQYNLLDIVQNYVLSQKGLRLNSLQYRYTVIRSFFIHNRAELPKDPYFQIRADVPPVKGTLTLENVRDIVLISTPAYRFAFLSMLQAGMGLEEFQYWNFNGWESLQKELREGKGFITIDLPGRKKLKNVKPYSTFLLEMGDAYAALMEYLPYRQLAREKFDRTQKFGRDAAEKRGEKYVEGKFNPNAIVYNNRGSPLVTTTLYKYWTRKSLKLKIFKKKGDSNPRNRYGKNPHEVRDLFRSQWEKTSAKESIGEHIMGHKIDPLEYNKAYRDIPWVINEIKKAMPMLNIMSSPIAFGLVDKDEFNGTQKQLEENLRKANLRIAELENKDNYEIISVKQEMSELKNQLNEMIETLKK